MDGGRGVEGLEELRDAGEGLGAWEVLFLQFGHAGLGLFWGYGELGPVVEDTAGLGWSGRLVDVSILERLGGVEHVSCVETRCLVTYIWTWTAL